MQKSNSTSPPVSKTLAFLEYSRGYSSRLIGVFEITKNNTDPNRSVSKFLRIAFCGVFMAIFTLLKITEHTKENKEFVIGSMVERRQPINEF